MKVKAPVTMPRLLKWKTIGRFLTGEQRERERASRANVSQKRLCTHALLLPNVFLPALERNAAPREWKTSGWGSVCMQTLLFFSSSFLFAGGYVTHVRFFSSDQSLWVFPVCLYRRKEKNAPMTCVGVFVVYELLRGFCFLIGNR